MGFLPRIYLASLLADFALYLAYAAVPFLAIGLGAGPLVLGLLPAVSALFYMGSAAVSGRLSDRVSRIVLARSGCVAFALACVAISTAPTVPLLIAAVPLGGLAMGMFWSPLQAALSDAAGRDRLTGSVAIFNIAWSLGKGLGFLVAGYAMIMGGPSRVILWALVPVLATAALLPGRCVRDAAPGAPGPHPEETEAPHTDSPLLRMAWMTNALAFGIGNALNAHAPRFLLEQGADERDFGLFLGAVFGIQTIAVAAFFRLRPGRSSLLASHLLSAAALVLFVVATSTFGRILAAIPLGVGLGLAYHSSIHASLDRPTGRGAAAGMHETLLGAGNSAVPLIGGAAAALSGSLAAPFVMCLVLLAVSVVWIGAWRPSRPREGV
ncbi:MAG: MFS transporter [Gemmatimonadota bacterium]|jgi:MFS family permease|nr:MFS transporter [Gemmatimonadota bacterium]MDP6528238.1 MFS transporter [Gemmatimonadota bacterium]MDP6802538.1 MFS transporter [Gemmatimonadota bacterium]MDP7031801.1 MFS transporter [Gemmatimonadota bacterium]